MWDRTQALSFHILQCKANFNCSDPNGPVIPGQCKENIDKYTIGPVGDIFQDANLNSRIASRCGDVGFGIKILLYLSVIRRL